MDYGQTNNHHANPVAMLKYNFITIFYVGTRQPKKEEMCVPIHIFASRKKDIDTSSIHSVRQDYNPSPQPCCRVDIRRPPSIPTSLLSSSSAPPPSFAARRLRRRSLHAVDRHLPHRPTRKKFLPPAAVVRSRRRQPSSAAAAVPRLPSTLHRPRGER